MNSSDFEPGLSVIYIPHHAKGDKLHKDCERGIITSTNSKYVFVRFYHCYDGVCILNPTPQACDPDMLIYE
ncbi:MAG: hypothetical protein WC444_05880 [Candidatus Paceibacterota bacterium]